MISAGWSGVSIEVMVSVAVGRRRWLPDCLAVRMAVRLPSYDLAPASNWFVGEVTFR
jgi:hypothetical protein